MLTYRTLSQQEYVDTVINAISITERHIAAVKDLRDGQATIGYGYTFSRNNNVALWEASGITLSSSELATLQQIDAATTNSEKKRIALQQFSRVLNVNEARALQNQTYPQYEGPANDLGMPFSAERAAFVSVTYNRGVGTVRKQMGEFSNAIQSEQRAEAWFQIRYNANAEKPGFADGIAKRRYYESSLFGLYDEGVSANTISEDQSRDVFRMYASTETR